MIDGIVLHNIIHELNSELLGGRMDKITQPEKDELILHIRANGKKHRLLMTVSASMPRLHLTFQNKINPPSPPSFCMLMRKYIGNGRLTSVKQYGLERIAILTFEQLNEMGDLCAYDLIIEIMGKHSNIILCNSEGLVLDSIKRVGAHISSVRQVYPGQTYSFPPNQGKYDLIEDDQDLLLNQLLKSKELVYKAIYMNLTGFSPFISNMIALKAGLNPNLPIESLSSAEKSRLSSIILDLKESIIKNQFSPTLILDSSGQYDDYHSLILLDELPEKQLRHNDSICALLNDYYEMKSIQVRMRQKTFDLRRLVTTILERSYKKLNIQNQQLKDTKNMDNFKIKGELLLANQYMVKQGDSSVEVLNYYTNEMTKITLDPTKTVIENANKAFEKYNKKKRTKEAVVLQIEKTENEIHYLETVKYSLDSAMSETDIEEIRHELMDGGYIRFRKGAKRKLKSKPYHYISTDGFHMYVGRNNLQNEELSTKVANGNDWWFHTKEVPGSHVIVRTEGRELTDRTYEEAAALAAYYSKARESTKVTVDYTQKKQLKKPAGSPPGYVIYHTNYSLFIDPNISQLEQVLD